jgi:transcriptional regulator with XRE-family HTH domain
VRWIRGIGDSRPRAAIARELGIDPSTVSRILLGETYQWIE